jgi:hypothetical protein
MQSIESKILEKVKRSKRGELIFPEDFYDVGSSEAIRTALHRLVKENSIIRVAHGIYVRPKDQQIYRCSPSFS